LNEEQSVVDFIYNTKHIITKINPISITTDFTSYYEKLTDLKGNTLDSINNEIEFPDEKPFLQELYDDIANSLNNTNIEITKIEHLNYCEKYHFKKNSDLAIINYYYNDKGIFTKTHPENNTNTSMELIEEIIGDRNYA